MKINWGTSIVLVFIAFISFILYFVIRMNTEKKYEHDLVVKDYYKQELAFQKEIDAEENSKSLNTNITVKKTDKGLVISFPKDKNYTKISGNIYLYRPSNENLDFKIPISLSESEFVIKGENMIEGRWNITIDWKYDNTPYMYKKSLTY
ncbi:FixH family protein [Aquimarina muelleri]|uniref:Cytochrome Cbb3 oxidase maturation protein CcoH n=1 Tax=Aquimarina muelleri TaxID=279356 RepID=A0A918JUX8_9FLAO|nr:FixH family protein [Aquimarina muelleri]MCX2762747.1 FixH family protein [Aquimarina muelleri]GGX18792.1 cytochrome Cbb3 oxidase maturation protein CcoH [Aquimarina muelleri]